MPHRRKDPPIASWTLPATAWATFVAQLEAEAALPGAPACSLRKSLGARGDVAIALFEDAAWVGDDELALLYLDAWTVRIDRDHGRLVFADHAERPSWIFPVPLVDLAHAEAFLAHQRAEGERRAAERAAPTVSNKLLDWVEGHFIAATLLFFFVLLPAFVFVVTRLAGD